MNRPETSTTFEVAAQSFAEGRRDNMAAFRRAHRHSRYVRFLRLAIPICLVLTVGGFTLSTWLNPLRMLKLPAGIEGLTLSGTKITMTAPKLTGYTRDDRRYELTASSAAQDITKPDIVELNEIHAKLEMQDKSTVELKAIKGLFDRKAGQLTLVDNIRLTSTVGVDLHLQEAQVDTGTGDIVSNKPVEVQMQQGTLNANRLQVTKSGEVIRFDGGVVMNLNSLAIDQAMKQ